MPPNNNPLADPPMPEATPTAQDNEIQTMMDKLWTEKTEIRKRLVAIQYLYISLESIQLLSRRLETSDPDVPEIKWYKPRDMDNRQMSEARRDEVFQRCKPEYDAMFP